MIYVFTEAGSADVVKVGYTETHQQMVNVVAMRRRLSSLQCANWRTLSCVAMAPGGRDYERQLHYEFRAQHRAGEWFEYRDAVVVWMQPFLLDVPIESTRDGKTFTAPHADRMVDHTHQRNRMQKRKYVAPVRATRTEADRVREGLEIDAWIRASVSK